MTFEAKLCELDKPTHNGRIYSTKVMEKALKDPRLTEQLENNCCFVYREDGIGSYMGRDITKICGLVKGFKIKDGNLYAELEDLSDKGLKPKIDAQCEFSIVGIGNLRYDENLDADIVEDYTMDAISLTSSPNFSEIEKKEHPQGCKDLVQVNQEKMKYDLFEVGRDCIMCKYSDCVIDFEKMSKKLILLGWHKD